MAVTNGWGQGVINNTNGWGKLATNTIGAGSVYENSASGDTVLVAPSAPSFASTQSFNFDGVNDTFNLGNITALNGGNSGSFSMWLKLDATGILGLFNQYGSGSDRLIYAFIWLAGGRIDIYISGNLAFRVSSNAFQFTFFLFIRNWSKL